MPKFGNYFRLLHHAVAVIRFCYRLGPIVYPAMIYRRFFQLPYVVCAAFAAASGTGDPPGRLTFGSLAGRVVSGGEMAADYLEL